MGTSENKIDFYIDNFYCSHFIVWAARVDFFKMIILNWYLMSNIKSCTFAGTHFHVSSCFVAKGMVELVPASDTLRKIQVEYGVTGSFKDKPLAEWLRKYNPSEEEYEKVIN